MPPTSSPASTSASVSTSRLPRIAFCSTAKNRTGHVSLTLPKNLADNADYPNLVHVLIDYASPDHLLPYIHANHFTDIASGRLALYRYMEQGNFRMGHAKNLAHRCGMLEGADILVNLDADNYTGTHFAWYVANQFIMAVESTTTPKEDIFLAAHIIPGMGRQFRGCGGRIVVSSRAYLLSGGYDETAYAAWGPDDKDLNARLQRLGFTPHEIPLDYLRSVPHSEGLRFREYPHARPAPTAVGVDGEESMLVGGDATIANFGRFGMGTVFRNFDITPIVLGPLPTRIFGVGMHKTATNSLHTALGILGYDSAHWKSARWAKNIWKEMTTVGRSLTLEKHYALCDLPITILYKELDKAYPGSKFILTTRSEESWLNSVRNHWDKGLNEFRNSWDSDPFTHKVHRLLYGQKNFDAEIFLARFRQHNAEVMEYFKDRPDDLLVMNMSHDAGWPELCRFLRHEILAGVDYPKKFRTKANGVLPV